MGSAAMTRTLIAFGRSTVIVSPLSPRRLRLQGVPTRASETPTMTNAPPRYLRKSSVRFMFLSPLQSAKSAARSNRLITLRIACREVAGYQGGASPAIQADVPLVICRCKPSPIRAKAETANTARVFVESTPMRPAAGSTRGLRPPTHLPPEQHHRTWMAMDEG